MLGKTGNMGPTKKKSMAFTEDNSTKNLNLVYNIIISGSYSKPKGISGFTEVKGTSYGRSKAIGISTASSRTKGKGPAN
jgi:hypothetical protein